MNCGPSWGVESVRSGCGWLLSGPGGASWAGRWAAGAKRPCASGGSRCRCITAGIVGSSPTSGKPTPRCCRGGSTGPAPKAGGRPASSRLLIVPCASVAACSCASPARSASRWPCTRTELKSRLVITISPYNRPPSAVSAPCRNGFLFFQLPGLSHRQGCGRQPYVLNGSQSKMLMSRA